MRSYNLVAQVTINREIWDKKKKEANSKDIDGSIFDLNWNLLFQDNPVNQKIKTFLQTWCFISSELLFLTKLVEFYKCILHG